MDTIEVYIDVERGEKGRRKQIGVSESNQRRVGYTSNLREGKEKVGDIIARLIGIRLYVCACLTTNVIEQIQGEREGEKELCYQASQQAIVMRYSTGNHRHLLSR